MKSSFLLLTFCLAQAVMPQAQQPAASARGPFSVEELQAFRAVGPVDAHTHVFAADPAYLSMLKKLNLHILDILVVDDMEPGRSDLNERKREALGVVHASRGYAALCTSFDPFSFQAPEYARNSIRALNEDFANGAIAVKLWKNVGMEIKDANGHYLMPDNSVFQPIFHDIAANNKTLIAHVADPDSAWQPPNPNSPDYEYYRDHPKSWMYGKKDVPTKAEILAARDRLLEKNPDLRVVGAHLGSMESNLAELGRHLDRYPNFAVDIAARMPYFEMQTRETMVAFMTKYQDRLIYGTDTGFSPGSKETMSDLESVYASDWRYFATGDTIMYKDRPVMGLNLPLTVLRKIYHDNAMKWFPGVVTSSL
jgi:predicted TIM-barrel fold metal-dependent hydrolase